ncbi:MAG: YhbY family RNA-binding protein [Myxococcota bacterium]|nr:YhbY family RNA-binding protein [Myxococcota bacterium]
MTGKRQAGKNPHALNRDQMKTLRGLGHSLKPCVRLGRNGVTDATVSATVVALRDHELIKIALNPGPQTARRTEAGLVADRAGAHVIHVIGRMALLYRRHPNTPSIRLPGRVLQKDDGDEPKAEA